MQTEIYMLATVSKWLQRAPLAGGPGRNATQNVDATQYDELSSLSAEKYAIKIISC